MTSKPRRARLWDLDDIVSASDLAAELGCRKATVANWALRYDDFPAPLTTVACGQQALYSLKQVLAWHQAREWRTDRNGKHLGGDRTRAAPPR